MSAVVTTLRGVKPIIHRADRQQCRNGCWGTPLFLLIGIGDNDGGNMVAMPLGCSFTTGVCRPLRNLELQKQPNYGGCRVDCDGLCQSFMLCTMGCIK